MISESAKEKIKIIDIKLNKILGYEAHDLEGYVNALLKFKRVEVGWREACGRTDPTQKTYKEFLKVLKILKKEGLEINETRVKHGNSWATKCGGFWSSIIYELK